MGNYFVFGKKSVAGLGIIWPLKGNPKAALSGNHINRSSAQKRKKV